MGSINKRHSKLFFDFRFRGQRCREYTSLEDTLANRRKMESVLKKIDEDITQNRFEYRRYFPNSALASKFDSSCAGSSTNSPQSAGSAAVRGSATDSTPLFSEFVIGWFRNKSVEWRLSYKESVEHILAKHLLPTFGDLPVGNIDRAAVLGFRTKLAASPRTSIHIDTATKNALSAATVNRVVGILSMILDEVAISYGITNPCRALKRLRLKKIDIQPFTIDEVRRLIDGVRPDYADYLRVRFLTGLRSGEVNGLKWEYVDFERREIRIRETIVRDRTEYTKTDGSQREIQMSQPVFDALKRMESATKSLGPYVFCTRNALPIDNHNFVNRIWNPLLRKTGLKLRRPYQMRHTCATLWLAAGENPEWIARQLGHASTQMLFNTYSRYVPNLTRRDGSAFDRLVSAAVLGGIDIAAEPTADVAELPSNLAMERKHAR